MFNIFDYIANNQWLLASVVSSLVIWFMYRKVDRLLFIYIAVMIVMMYLMLGPSFN